MKKFISAVLVCFMLCSVVSVFAVDTEIVINGENAVIGEGMGCVTEKDGVKFVPLRFVLEYLGYEVTWNGDEKLIFGRNTDGDVMVMQVGSVHWVYNNVNLELTAAPYINEADSRTYVPFECFADALGYEAAASEDGTTVSMIAKTEAETSADTTDSTEAKTTEEIKSDENTAADVNADEATTEKSDIEENAADENATEEDVAEDNAEDTNAEEDAAKENTTEAE